MDVNRRVTVSAPGKVLLTGGYLVLERPYSGLVLSCTCRFHSRVAWAPAAGADAAAARAARGMAVRVDSPQFRASYGFVFGGGGGASGWSLLAPAAQTPNPLVETAVAHALTCTAGILPRGSFRRLLR